MGKPCFLFDIDGTIANLSHRLHHLEQAPKDWNAFFAACHQDEPISHIRTLMQALCKGGAEILYVSGRSDQVLDETCAWIIRHDFPVAKIFMRREGDHRPDHIVKAELLDMILDEGWRPIMAFDDRDQVVKMWRDKGIPCAQVAPGDF